MTSVNDMASVAFLKNGKIDGMEKQKRYSSKNKNLRNFIEGIV